MVKNEPCMLSLNIVFILSVSMALMTIFLHIFYTGFISCILQRLITLFWVIWYIWSYMLLVLYLVFVTE